MSRVAPILIRLLTWATFAIWFGGFTFYVSIVVPTGTEIMGTARAQGAITRAVTPWLNGACGLAVLMMLVDAAWTYAPSTTQGKSSRARWWGLASALVILLLLIALVILHPKLDGMIEGEGLKIRLSERDTFYQWHRAYLWVSTLQWIAAWVWLGSAVWRFQSQRVAPPPKTG